jgi:hypothetical protein
MKSISILIILLIYTTSFSQIEKETITPFNIKTISFVQNNQNAVPVFKLGDGFQLQFDDLFGNEANYYYEITHYDYNWKPSDIPKSEYLYGFDNQRIQQYTNSFNTLQLYSHYKLPIPNQFTRLLLSGNYIIKILNEDKEIVFSRKFILYEDLVTVPTQIKRPRTVINMNTKQNIEFAIKSKEITFQNPLKNTKVTILQNGQLNNSIKNVPPQYTIGNDLIYKYDSETQFWAGNEFLNFDNKEIRAAGNSISLVDTNNEIYNTHLYPNSARTNQPYSFIQDVNGNFVIRNLYAENQETESDYAWVYFTLSAPTFTLNKNIYITGMFNNYNLTPENKMEYNSKKGVFEKAILIKQGFTNYQYSVYDTQFKLDSENTIDGNFFQTENQYTVIVYYRSNTDRYDRVIGKGEANSINSTN